uniref:Serine aminopeptidase S33 domain-containing protein n=1 Tax=Chromera velia CCMP2878 TaxID=1169474 RepID=A0A0G4HJ30_9ALVE|mmetsp:Transcript_22826/g.44972  ORF Transcript_22826/g.44972 Transcript_22826/m.44972 type:complete len:485 (+) Transcript_22826:189-1643(+)|eukprot:Cvel_7026.t1-p1 / transcript=Cvel_7026.t1 / gene=Cvel_7026 / organism=Chromera_velia_CCMP2878 / gene_product=Uncharacterized abhydrolase domain-containing, putative / transcript_product=Uncharacterized abhydrolase domain-containing, putative / location=Cvel_scaffold358:41470-48754(+) / protein_length=484 / sequence_SO=supercontig / SO=protein_coding / is_pseudo=false
MATDSGSGKHAHDKSCGQFPGENDGNANGDGDILSEGGREEALVRRASRFDVHLVSDAVEELFQYAPREKIVPSCSCETYLHHRRNMSPLMYRRYDPPGGVGAVANLCIFHGFGEHSGRYADMANHFKSRGFVVHTVDFRGCGYSGGARAASTVDVLCNDVTTVLDCMDPALPCFILGHSMGGLTVAKYLLENPGLPIAGVIFSSALFRLGVPRHQPWLKRKLVQAINIKDIFTVADVDPCQLTRDLHEVTAMLSDRFCLPLMGMQLAASVMNEPFRVMARAGEFKYPCLIFHGDKDLLTCPTGSEEFYENISSSDKTLKIFEGAFHEVHNDLCRLEMFDLVSKWMTARASSAPLFGYIDNYRNPLVPIRQRQRWMRKMAVRLASLLYVAVFWGVWRMLRSRGIGLGSAGRSSSSSVSRPLLSRSLLGSSAFLSAAFWPVMLLKVPFAALAAVLERPPPRLATAVSDLVDAFLLLPKRNALRNN